MSAPVVPAPDATPATPSAPGHALPADGQARAILDTDDGLERIMGDRALYAKLLWRFKHDYQHFHTQFCLLIDGGQYGAARVKSHTLKGAAGMIGARTMHALASELEAALRAQAPVPVLPLVRLQQGLQQLMVVLDQHLPLAPGHAAHPVGAAAAQESNPADPATLVLIGRLAYFLQEGDGAAIDVLENSASVLAAALGVAVYQEVAAAAHEFDFETALLALRQRR